MRAPIGFKFQSSNSAEGWGVKHLDPLIMAGIPPCVMALDMAGPVWEAQEKMRRAAWSHAKQRTAALVYRHTLNDVPDYRADPAQSAAAMWEYHRQKWPPELDRRIVYGGIVNEPATFLSRGEGYEHPLRRVMVNPSSQLAELDNSEWLAAHALELCRRALAAGVRFSVLGWSPGTPEAFQWRGPKMTELLDLLRAHPDDLALDLHEYSLEPGAMPQSSLIGRFRNIPAPWPSMLISEWGYTLREAPPAAAGVGQLLGAYGSVYAYPQVKGLAIWTLGKEGEGWGDLGQVINGYLEPLTRGILDVDFTPIVPPAPNEGAMILDLSRWNGTLDAVKMRAAGVKGVILRAAAGAVRDTMVDTYAPALKAAGIPIVGCYLYYHPYEPWRPQLDALKAVMAKHGIRRGYLDLEDTRTVATLARDAETFMAALTAEMPLPAGKRHGIYSNVSYWRQMGAPAWGAAYDLWIAAWTEVASPVVPAPWQRWTLWQYSNSGNGPAYGLQSARVDLNRFNGTAAQLAEWLKIEDAPVDVPAAIRAKAAEQPGAGWNPAHALPLAAIRDGYLPVGPEFDVTAGGVTYRALRAFDRTGKGWIYYAPVPRWNEVTRIAL